MRTLYMDCGMGAAGDMLTGALLELHPNPEVFLRRMNHLGIPCVRMTAEKSLKCGIVGTHVSVKIHDQEEDEHLHDQPHSHHHGTMSEIRSIVSAMPVPNSVKLDILAVYQQIGEAESLVHGVPVHQIHFHEVGSMDAVADITAVCLLMHELNVDQVICSPVHVGSGTVRCAHGILPVPAPATAQILKDIPIYGGSISGELCTPTGAALLKYFVDRFEDMPPMRVSKIGYGMGNKDFPRANCLRVLLGETPQEAETIMELTCNVDDMTGEEAGFALDMFMSQGALDAFTTPIGMKKSRPGMMMTILCPEKQKEKFLSLMFKHTTTLGIRTKLCQRFKLERSIEKMKTPYGEIRKKISQGYGVCREKLEYEDLAQIAKANNLSIQEIRETITQKYSENDLI